MGHQLSWYDKYVIPVTKEYKNFVDEMKNTSPEQWFRDGERIFTEKERKYMDIYEHKQKKMEAETKKSDLDTIPIISGTNSFSPQNRATFSSRYEEEMEATRSGFSLEDVLEPNQMPKEFVKHFINEIGEQGFEPFQQYYQNLEPEYKKLFLDEVETGIFNSDIESENRIEAFHVAQEVLSIPIKSIKHNINPQNPDMMETQKEFNQVEYLKNQLKYLGFGEDEKLHKDLEKGINSQKQQFEINTTSDKALPGNKVDFTLKFNKTENGGIFLNAYHAKLTNEKGDEISHNFPVNRENTFTAKEAVNLLEGRSVKIEFHNPKSDQTENAFVQFNFEEPKTEKGNYMFQNFYKNYGVDTEKIVEKANLVFDQPEYKENTIKSLEKGNVVKVKFEMDDKVVDGKAVLNPQYKNLNLYDSEMNRINTNKPLQGLDNEEKNEKATVREQSIKR